MTILGRAAPPSSVPPSDRDVFDRLLDRISVAFLSGIGWSQCEILSENGDSEPTGSRRAMCRLDRAMRSRPPESTTRTETYNPMP